MVTAENVTVDLGGFSIIGPTACNWDGCAPTGSGVGISGDADVTVLNGTVRGMGHDGIRLGRDARVERVKVIENGGGGVSVGAGRVVANVIADRNGGSGLASEYCTVRDSVAHANKGAGIQAGCVATVIGNSSTSNGGVGIGTGGTSGCASNLACENDQEQLRAARRWAATSAATGCARSSGACRAPPPPRCSRAAAPGGSGRRFGRIAGLSEMDPGELLNTAGIHHGR